MEYNNFSENLKKIRKYRGLKQVEVAEKIGVGKSTYCQYENGQRQPDVLKLMKIANVLKVSGDELLGLKNDGIIYQENIKNSEESSKKIISDIIENYEKLNDKHKKFIENQIKQLLELQNSN